MYDNISIPLSAVNHEPRTETLKSYSKIEGRYDEDISRRDTVFRAPFYFNPFHDTVGIITEMQFNSLDTLLKAFEENGLCAGVTALEKDIDRRCRLRLLLGRWSLDPVDNCIVRWSENLEDDSCWSKELVFGKTIPGYTTV
jgi:hypothetical protein